MTDTGGGDVATREPTTGALPHIVAEVREDGTGEISVDGVLQRIAAADLAEAGAQMTSRIATLAQEAGRALPVEVRDPDGLWALVIHPDGRVDEATDADEVAPLTGDVTAVAAPGAVPAAGGPLAATSAPTAAVAPAPAPPTTGATPAVDAPPPATRRGGPATGATPAVGGRRSSGPATGATPAVGGTSLPTLDDLLAARHPAHEGPAERGWQRTVRRLTFGAVTPQPGRAERVRRSQVEAVRRTFDGPRTVVVVNPKGGAHKTTATMMLAATFGLHRGGYTLAWDNNETRGTLGWRSSHADHTRTAVDLLHALPDLTGRGTLRIGDLDSYVRTQPKEQFDVLASDENAASVSSVDAESFRALHQVLSQFYRVLVVDTGNNMRASNWRAAVDTADQLVVVSTLREDTAQSAAWALDALRATGHEELVRQAVTILSFPEPKVDKDLRQRLRSHFGALTRAVVEVPHDRALVTGGPIAHASLRPSTRDAWLRATAVVADGL
ncbi:MinD/ParA family ATP-binding protein [Cellulomonas shaoxiangyii]|uniref:Chromosome partitioning protein n=2 Tax=Cellulomonas shaoxiangyii TaxID=2566013 RepID=A0A4P7SM62_9CELL|nr:chromosome partitioning protein [Cellulomonas shaoxiangyii]QCB94647.1 chromosome partitioning protein [Cellulomonas shaoxiangyii]